MVMILLSFTHAELNSKNDASLCSIKCAFKCKPKASSEYEKCIKDCESHCNTLSPDPIFKCLTSCDLMKVIAYNTGAHDLANNVMNTCMEECTKKL
ncbi:hypothetical protein VIGAN_UM001800 [Vigna angularis var. angularis]|uniref:Uncharacterized protein n=1 Tax=Vigna angularis var. angularis TaxID=157739 RepID=A0A0S3TD84_PHAAN|nr:hypothetical protein VIGAN_UM001800 [Vigna angularis var. angularis]